MKGIIMDGLDGLTFEIVIKKFAIGCFWKDAELQREAICELGFFPQDSALEGDHPVLKRIAAEKKAAEENGCLQNLLEQWYQEVLPYIRYKIKCLYKYFGDLEVRPLWQRHSANVKMNLNTQIACLEQTGPLTEEDIATIVRAMKDSIGHERGLGILYDAIDEVLQKHLERKSKEDK